MPDPRRREIDHLEYFLRQWYGSSEGRAEIQAYLPQPERINAPLERIMKGLTPKYQVQIDAIHSIWSDVVGAMLASHCRPTSFRGKALVIECDRQVYFVELLRQKKAILARIHELLDDSFCNELCYVPVG